jgi:hypothetical protein
MFWSFVRPDCWEPLRGTLIHWDRSKPFDESLASEGYTYLIDSPKGGTVGAWCLYGRYYGSRTLPKYFLLVDNGMGESEEIYIPSFPDLMCYMAKYGNVLKG